MLNNFIEQIGDFWYEIRVDELSRPNKGESLQIGIDKSLTKTYNTSNTMQNVQSSNSYLKFKKVVKTMETTLGVTKARDKLSEIVESVQYHNDAYIISRHGRPAAAVVPIEVYEFWKRRRKEFFDTIRRFQEASGEADPDEVMRDVLEAQQAVRAQQSS